MSLQVWLPLTKDLRNQGLSDVTVTNYGATFNSAGKLGGCYSFNGSSYITVQDVVLQNIWSYSCWLYSDISSRSWEVVMVCNINGGDADMQLGLYTRPSGNIIQNTANGQYNASISMTYGQWNHFVGTFDGANLKTYLNGVLVNTKAITNAKLDRPKLTIGARCRGSSYDCYFQGLLNDVRIYDHCLSPMEVKELAKGLILHYPLNRGGWGQENLISNSQLNGSWTYPSSSYSDKYSPTTLIVPSKSVYTLSFDAKSTVNGDKIRTHYYSPNTTTTCTSNQGVVKTATDGNMDFTLTTSWKRYWVIYNQSETTAIKHIICPRLVSGNGTGTVSVRNVKFEEGSIATPWCPNSSDALATAMGLNGTTEYDCSGFCNNANSNGSVSLTYSSDTPKYNVSTVFASGARIATPVSASTFMPTGSITVSIWFKSSNAANRFLSCTEGGGFNFESASGKISFPIYITGKGYTRVDGNTTWSEVSDNEWHMITATYDKQNTILYVDGQLDKSTVSSYPNIDIGYSTITPFTLGAEAQTIASPIAGTYVGNLSDCRIYATALSADDVKSLYQNSAYIDSSGNVYGAVHSEV